MGNRIVVIGASLGGIQALSRIVADLPKDFSAPILIVQHIEARSPGMLPRILTKAGLLPAVHPASGDELKPGVIYVAPPDRHMFIENGRVRLSHGPKENLSRPAIDPLFRSAAIAYGARVVGVVLTGQLDDGTAGLLAIKDCGGTTIVQDPLEASAPSMPRSALRHVPIDHRCRLAELGAVLSRLADDPQSSAPPSTSRLIEIEWRIASGDFTVSDWWQLDQIGSPSALTCPDCAATLYELSDARIWRFRCRSGHAFTGESLLAGQADTRERLLASVFSALLEEATLVRRLSERRDDSAHPDTLARLRDQLAWLERQAEQIRGSLHAAVGLVEPEPAFDRELDEEG